MFRRKNKVNEKKNEDEKQPALSRRNEKNKEQESIKMTDLSTQLVCNLSSYEDTNFNTTLKEITMKVCIVGDYGVGKSSIVENYIKGTFSDEYRMSIGADFANKIVNYDENTLLNLQLWDIAGSEKHGYYTSVYYRYAVGAIIVFDMSRPETFTSVLKWLEDIRARSFLPSGKNIPVLLIGNKCDVNSENPIENVQEFCKKNKILGMEHVSAKTRLNIRAAMDKLIKEMLKNHKKLWSHIK